MKYYEDVDKKGRRNRKKEKSMIIAMKLNLHTIYTWNNDSHV